MRITDTEATQYLLYTPFTKEYSVSQKVKGLMTKEAFFDRIFLKPSFLENDGVDAPGIASAYAVDYVEEANDGHSFEFLNREEVRRRTLNADRAQAFRSFKNWIDDDANSAYIVKGDAGAGKTTFIHYIEYLFGTDDLAFDFVDIRDANEAVEFYGEEIRIRDYGSLSSKAISAMLSFIRQKFFPLKDTYSEIVAYLKDIYLKYEKKRIAIKQHKEVEFFFEPELLKPLFEAKDYSEDEAKTCFLGYVNDLGKKLDVFINNTDNKSIVIDRLLDVLMILVRCEKHAAKKHVICFDNIEKFLHQDEISNYEVTRFVNTIQSFINKWILPDFEFPEFYKIIILMRNTSIRVDSVSRAQAEFGGHVLDLTEWFSVDGIVDKKLQWYRDNDISFHNMEIIDKIIGKRAFDANSPRSRSLQEKLSLLFNNDKRLIVTILDRAITHANAINTKIIRNYENIIDDSSLQHDQRTMAARSIMLRLVFDVLSEDSFFATLRNELGHDDRGEEVKVRQSYSRKILTYLNNRRVRAERHRHYSTYYISFGDLVGKLGFGYFTPNNRDKRETVSKILFAMNNFNRRNADYVHLIDIQFDDDNRTILKGPNDLSELASYDANKISVSILDAGSAYLLYVVASFEYFASREDGYVEPLFACLPALSEVRYADVKNFKCLNIINRVYDSTESCISYMRKSKSQDIDYISPINDVGKISHIDRIKNVHTGYLTNFIACVRAKCATYSLNYEEQKKVNVLIREIEKVIKKYQML